MDPGQGTSVEYEITDGHHVSPHGHVMKGNDLEEHRRADRQMNWRKLGRVWDQYTEAFSHPMVIVTCHFLEESKLCRLTQTFKKHRQMYN